MELSTENSICQLLLCCLLPLVAEKGGILLFYTLFAFGAEENVITDFDLQRRERDFTQLFAVEECEIADRFNAAGKMYFFELFASGKRIITDRFHAMIKNYFIYNTVGESLTIDLFHAARYGDLEERTLGKSIHTDDRHRGGNFTGFVLVIRMMVKQNFIFDVDQSAIIKDEITIILIGIYFAAHIKSTFADFRYSGGDGQTQHIASGKCLLADGTEFFIKDDADD